MQAKTIESEAQYPVFCRKKGVGGRDSARNWDSRGHNVVPRGSCCSWRVLKDSCSVLLYVIMEHCSYLFVWYGAMMVQAYSFSGQSLIVCA